MSPRLVPATTARPFELTGEYGGFVFTDKGKRRLRLCSNGHEHLLKVPKVLRHRMIANYRHGQEIRVIGNEDLDAAGAVRRIVATHVCLAIEAPATVPGRRRDLAAPIEVCTKKNCWRAGGRELWRALQEELARSEGNSSMRLEAVNCLDRCKHAPNAQVGERAFRSCAAKYASQVVEAALAVRPPVGA